MTRSTLTRVYSLWKAPKNLIGVFIKDKLGRSGAIILTFFVFLAIFAPYIEPYNPESMLRAEDGSLKKLLPPSSEHLLGTTYMGRDIFSQLVHGSRNALFIGVIAAALVSLVGLILGLIAGYYGGRVDRLLMSIVDVTYGVPFLPFIIVIVAILGPGIWNVPISLAIIGWRTCARIIRSQVLSLKERPFVEAAKVIGASNARIIFIHITPNVIPLALLYGVFAIGWAIMTEASVSFLGLGDPKAITWGSMLHEAFAVQAITRGMYWWIIPPGVCISLLVISCYFLQRSLEEYVNPRLRTY